MTTTQWLPTLLLAATLSGCGLLPGLGTPSELETYSTFESELIEDLATEWGATTTTGCPTWEPVYAGRDQEERAAAWPRHIPGRQCDCIQETVMDVRNRLMLIDPERYTDAEIAEIEEWKTTLGRERPIRWALVNVYTRENHDSPERAQTAVDEWNTSRYGPDGESGWQAMDQPVPPGDSIGRFGPCDGLTVFPDSSNLLLR